MNIGIKYISTNKLAPAATLRDALLIGLAPDGGLYLPDKIPVISREELEQLRTLTYNEVAFRILRKFLCPDIENDLLAEICKSIYRFDVPLEKITDNKFIMRLDRGPTASFKDFAALLMARLTQHFLQEGDQRATILTATSGDTGGAVAHAFCGMENINVIILFPGGEIAPLQRKQITTAGKNIRAVSIDGTFDDCQQIVKEAFMDNSLKRLNLSSANSINIGRLLPQVVYYFWGWCHVTEKIDTKVLFSVPSGNLGNLTAGVIAKRMGLPVERFIVSTNENDEVPAYIRTGEYNIISPSKNCISNSMNVGNPSNMARIAALYGGIINEKGRIIISPDIAQLRKDFFALSVSDDTTKKTISECFRRYGTIIEPHGAAAWEGICSFLKTDPAAQFPLVALETAHPAKFPKEIISVLNIVPEVPQSLHDLTVKEEEYISLDKNYGSFCDFINEYY